ncbi:hypothetical protein I6A84_00595 [Frankia sp. CNm7]|uniref:Thioesterase domain-containing protein n=1 Tax=Frankia nepalensis TaxID=1836974 RepID=A0A937UMZ7_9ACTN|nr:acyl-CoA thioesterase domain-containing protein [Frankia nepalensis]MBL7496653.1 hypothetical protein [Frankia nepalensis]MBL7510705.1 hypothetical protein [Frankia nepalensis]MBL7516662.1 hypothetical protein [Frankia nepalensis]MBL7627392.1 hypothetical protein [Frankia nepalensis]
MAEQTDSTVFGDEFTRFVGYESVRTSETTASSWVPARADLLDADGALLPVVLSYLVDSTPGVVCGAAALPDWVITTDLHMQVFDRHVKGPVRADATLVHANRVGVLAEVNVVDEGDGERLVATGSVNHARVPLTGSLDVPIMPVGVRYHGPADAAPPGDRLAREIVFEPEAAGGEIGTALTPLSTNPLGIMHGSVTSALSISAATSCVGGDLKLTELLVRFCGSVRKGPARANAELVRSDESGSLVRVAVRDDSYPQRIAVLASVRFGSPG